MSKITWKDVGAVVGKVAPILGTVVGGPAGGAIGSAVALLTSAFGMGSDAQPDQVLAAIEADPEARLKLIKIQNDHQIELGRLANEIELSYLHDRQNARGRDVELRKTGDTNIRANIMLLAAFTAVVIIAALAATGNVEGSVLGFLFSIGGMFARNIGTAFDFEFGSSRGSQSKSDMLERMNGMVKK